MMTSSRSAASLCDLVRAMGGDLSAGGRRALVPAPGHSSADRSVSLLLEDDGRVVAHTFGGGDWREVLDDLRQRGWIDADNRLLVGGAPVTGRPAPAPERTRAERAQAARRLWAAGGAITPQSPAARHIALRGIELSSLDLEALRAHSAAPGSVYQDRGPRRAALLAAVRDPAGELTAVEITYLDHAGRRHPSAKPARKVVGVLPAGSAVRLARAGPAMVTGEGVFTTLSAMRRFALPGWALLSTTNLRRWIPPDGVRHVIVAADRGSDGERSAAELRDALAARAVFAEVALPPAGFGDWNDLDRKA